MREYFQSQFDTSPDSEFLFYLVRYSVPDIEHSIIRALKITRDKVDDLPKMNFVRYSSPTLPMFSVVDENMRGEIESGIFTF